MDASIADPARFLDCLASDYARLREVAAKDLDAPVPSCPGWRVADLVHHVAEVYLHKVEAMRRQQAPSPWPPPEIDGIPPIPLVERAWDELSAEFAKRPADDPAYTFYEPEQTVGFWIRRMAQETVIHRIDAELALGDTVEPVPDDLALDGVDEVLVVFLAYASARWPEDFGDDLAKADPRPVVIACGGVEWAVRSAPDGITVTCAGGSGAAGDGTDDAGATVRATPEAMLRWLWSRGDDEVTVEGDEELVAGLRRLLVIATQ
jgi:uncharacterized protein (TIGR03083 family)